MTAELHNYLATLPERFFSEGISDEEWALLQVHMAYCGPCLLVFEKLKLQNQVVAEPDRGDRHYESRPVCDPRITWMREQTSGER
jgi:hypothetical protein